MARTALVTGASGGIGSVTARELARDHDVVVHYHDDRESAEDVATDVRDAGQAAVVHQCDVRDHAAAEEMVARAREAVGGVDVLVNNAGVFQIAPLESASDETIRQTLRVNLEGAVYCARAVLPDMLENGEGRIVNVSSTAFGRLSFWTAIVLFMSPILLIIHTLIFAGGTEGSAEAAGAAIGGTILVIGAFVIGIPVGLGFYLLSRRYEIEDA